MFSEHVLKGDEASQNVFALKEQAHSDFHVPKRSGNLLKKANQHIFALEELSLSDFQCLFS